MAGLLNRQPQGEQARTISSEFQDAKMAPAQDEQSNVSPEEQTAYDEFVTNGMRLMYSEQTLPQVLETIRGDDDSVEGMANALVMLVIRLEDSANKDGHEISGDVKMHGATELLEQMAELAREAGVHDFSEEEMETVLYRALDLYREQRQDSLQPEVFQEDIEELKQAEQAGQLEEVLPGINQFAQQRAPGARGGAAQQQPANRRGG